MIVSDGDTAQQNGVVVVDSFGDEIGIVGKVCVPTEQAVAARADAAEEALPGGD